MAVTTGVSLPEVRRCHYTTYQTVKKSLISLSIEDNCRGVSLRRASVLRVGGAALHAVV